MDSKITHERGKPMNTELNLAEVAKIRAAAEELSPLHLSAVDNVGYGCYKEDGHGVFRATDKKMCESIVTIVNTVIALLDEVEALETNEKEYKANCFDLIAKIAKAAKCLPSVFIDGNGHIIEAIDTMQAQLISKDKENEALKTKLRQYQNID